MSLPIEYIAGFFDGEGCVTIYDGGKPRRRDIRVTLTNTSPKVLEEIRAMFAGPNGRGTLIKVDQRKYNKNWKPIATLIFHSGCALKFLKSVQPHVRVRKQQVELAIEFLEFKQRPVKERCEWYKSGRGRRLRPEVVAQELEYKDAMHILNRKGVVN